MLQTKDLVKVYKPKKGVPVKALDKVSLTFPEKGMVFLLGKSGSGKSTLLNVLGGLDRYDSGDISIMGKSTKNFRQRHFDSYRNTYVGFIFQEYNILDEFSVGTNIALALQLQGIKPTTEQIHSILHDVDLEGYGNRNPNELSGGQKQRVAIARALVKSPKIIMADEPTGALDSATGRQVLNTLKKLSREKLVIVVSHDREFAEQYADRIVELADGKVIRDVERLSADDGTDGAVPVYLEDSVSLPESYQLTDEDREAIGKYIQNMINQGKEPRFSLFSKRNSGFQPTDESRIPVSSTGYKLIKSRLPAKYAFKLGASGLKHKKFRLVMTILLSCIALGLFGLANTIASYNYADTAFKSLTDPSNRVTYAAFEKEWTDEEAGRWGYSRMTEKDLELIRNRTGLDVRPVYECNVYLGGSIPNGEHLYLSSYYMTNFSGTVAVDQKLLDDMGATLVAGKLPESSNEVAVSTSLLDTYREYGYFYNNYNTGETSEPEEIKTAEDLIGKRLWAEDMELFITGVVETGLDMSRYDGLLNVDYDNLTFVQQIGLMALQSELSYSRGYSLAGMLMVSDKFENTAATNQMMDELSYFSALYPNGSYINPGDQGGRMRLFSTCQAEDKVIWLDGQKRTELAENEMVIGVDFYHELMWMKYDEIPSQYDFYFLKDFGGSFEAIRALEFKLQINNIDYPYYYDYSEIAGTHDMKIVGVLPEDYQYYVSDAYTPIQLEGDIKQTLSPIPSDPQALRRLVDFSAEDLDTSDEGLLTYNLMNPVTFELKNLNDAFEILGQVFFWVGLVFVIFASLLFSNFIATSISYKKQEIGILRAIGSRSNDVFRIFFAESFIIAMINFVLSFGGTVLVCWLANSYIKSSTGILLTILNVGIKQAILLFAVCLLSAFVASWLPVYKIASKRPIDAIRDR